MTKISLCLSGLLVGLALPCLASSTNTVTNTNAAGAGSLSNAIFSANSGSGTNLIWFNIPPLDGTLKTITPASGGLPFITHPMIIDGYTQDPAHSHPNTLTNRDDAVLLIENNGATAGSGSLGLSLRAGSGGSTVRGLVLDNG